tara:strand:+ start:371 stop:529 length:159 start_codon:yes stop_codon:yes gene_type:complete
MGAAGTHRGCDLGGVAWCEAEGKQDDEHRDTEAQQESPPQLRRANVRPEEGA